MPSLYATAVVGVNACRAMVMMTRAFLGTNAARSLLASKKHQSRVRLRQHPSSKQSHEQAYATLRQQTDRPKI